MFATIITEITQMCADVVASTPNDSKALFVGAGVTIASLVILRTEKTRVELENQEEK